jgi:hypothetical protein
MEAAAKHPNTQLYFIGNVGSDAGGWYIGADGKIHRIPGWNPEAIRELGHAVSVIREAGQLKTPGLADAAIKSVMDFVQREVGGQLKGGGVLVVG